MNTFTEGIARPKEAESRPESDGLLPLSTSLIRALMDLLIKKTEHTNIISQPPYAWCEVCGGKSRTGGDWLIFHKDDCPIARLQRVLNGAN